MAVKTENGGKGAQEGGRAGLRRQLVEREIAERAAELFAERGFAGTTVQDIADALGMSRPALYYYVKSKEVILEQLVEHLSVNDAKALEKIAAAKGGEPSEKLRAMALQLATTAGSNPHQTQILSQSKHHLPDPISKLNLNAERTIAKKVIEVLEAGIKKGQFREVHPRTAALSIIGTCLWVAWWVEDSPLDPIAEQVADQAVNSVLAADGDTDVEEPAALLRSARANLDRLQRSLDE